MAGARHSSVGYSCFQFFFRFFSCFLSASPLSGAELDLNSFSHNLEF